MKDEVKEKLICAFVGSKSKVYSSVVLNNEESQKQKMSIKMLSKT